MKHTVHTPSLAYYIIPWAMSSPSWYIVKPWVMNSPSWYILGYDVPKGPKY